MTATAPLYGRTLSERNASGRPEEDRRQAIKPPHALAYPPSSAAVAAPAGASTLDELQQRCQGNTGGVSLLPNVCEDVDVAGRLDFKAIGDGSGAMLTGFEGPYQDLLTRQLRLIMRRLTDPV